MGLVLNFVAQTGLPNQIDLNWNQPLGFNNTTDEIIVTKTITHFPVELFNTDQSGIFENKATDPRPIEIFRGSTIPGITPGTISVSGSTLTDTSATFPTNPSLIGRLLRDTTSAVFRIISNTSTKITVIPNIVDVNGISTTVNPSSGIYVVLADFPITDQPQQNYINNAATIVGSGFIQNLYQNINSTPTAAILTPGSLSNLIFVDSAGTLFLIKDNNENTVFFFESATPTISSAGYSIKESFKNSQPLPYVDTFKVVSEAMARVGTGLLDNTFYYYTAFTKTIGVNVAQAEFSLIESSNSTQSSDISTKDRKFGTLLYNTWPSLDRELDATGDHQDLMSVFGFQFNMLHSLIDTYNLQDSQTVFYTALLALSEQTGLPSVGFSIGVDTLRRIAENQILCYKLKGSKEGIAVFIREITTWDITNGTGDYSSAIIDSLMNTGFRFYDPQLALLNTRFTQTSPFVPGGRFLIPFPGVSISGFFTVREFTITVPNVALFVGSTTNFSLASNTTTMTDATANFGPTNGLVDNFLISNQNEFLNIYKIVANTATTITVVGTIINRTTNNPYAVLSPLNTNRFMILNNLLPEMIPFGTQASFKFT